MPVLILLFPEIQQYPCNKIESWRKRKERREDIRKRLSVEPVSCGTRVKFLDVVKHQRGRKEKKKWKKF